MNKRGYSLVELLVAAAILGSGLAGVMTAYRNMDETNARAKTNIVTKSLYRQIKKRVSSRVGELVCGPSKAKDGTLQVVKSIRDRGRRQVKYQPVDFFQNSPKTTPWQLVSVKGQSNNQVGCLNDEAFDGAKKELLNYLLGSASGTEHVCAKKIELVPKNPVNTGGDWEFVESDDVYLCEHEHQPSNCTYPIFTKTEEGGKATRDLQSGWERVKLQQYMAYLRVHLHKPRRFGSGNKSATVARALFVDFPVYFSVNGLGSGSTSNKLVDCSGSPLTSKHITKGFKDFVVNTKAKGRGLEVIAAAKKHRTQTVKVTGRDTASTKTEVIDSTKKAIGDTPHYEDAENILANPDIVYGEDHAVCKSSGVVLRCPGTYHPFVMESFLDIVAGSDKQTPWVSAGSADLENKLKSVFPNNCGCKVLAGDKQSSFDIARACAEDHSTERRSLDQCLHTQCDIGVSFATTFDNKCIKKDGAGGDPLPDIWDPHDSRIKARVDDDDKSALNAWRKSVQDGEGESYEACSTGCDSVNLMQGGDEQHKGKYWPVLVSDFMQGGKDANFDNTKDYVKRYQCMRCVLDDRAVCPHVSGAVGLREVEKFDTLRACMFRAVHAPRDKNRDGSDNDAVTGNKITPDSGNNTFASYSAASAADKVAAIDIKENLKSEGVKSLWCAEDSKAEYEGLCGANPDPTSVKLRDDCLAATKSCGSLIGGGVAQFFNTSPLKFKKGDPGCNKDGGCEGSASIWSAWEAACDSNEGSVLNYWCQIIKNGCTEFKLAEHLTPLSTDWTQAQYGDNPYGDNAWWATEIDWSSGPIPPWGMDTTDDGKGDSISRQAQIQHNYHRYWCKINVPQEDGGSPAERHVGVAVNQGLAVIRLDKSEITRNGLTDSDLDAIGQLHLTSTDLGIASVGFTVSNERLSNTNVLALDGLGFFRPDTFEVKDNSISDSFLVNNSDAAYGAAHPEQFRDKVSDERKKAQARARACYENHDHTKHTGTLDLNSPRNMDPSHSDAKNLNRWDTNLFDYVDSHTPPEFSVQYEMQKGASDGNLNGFYDEAFDEAVALLKVAGRDVYRCDKESLPEPTGPASPPQGGWSGGWACTGGEHCLTRKTPKKMGLEVFEALPTNPHILPLVKWDGFNDDYSSDDTIAHIKDALVDGHEYPGDQSSVSYSCSRSYSYTVSVHVCGESECGCAEYDPLDPSNCVREDCCYQDEDRTQTVTQSLSQSVYDAHTFPSDQATVLLDGLRSATQRIGREKVEAWLDESDNLPRPSGTVPQQFFRQHMYKICDGEDYNMPVYNFAFLCGKNVVNGTSDNNKLFPSTDAHETVGGAATPLPLGCCLHYAKKYDEYELIDELDLPSHLNAYNGRIYYMGPTDPEACFQWTLNSFDKSRDELTD